jgi:hypothetical protein
VFASHFASTLSDDRPAAANALIGSMPGALKNHLVNCGGRDQNFGGV